MSLRAPSYVIVAQSTIRWADKRNIPKPTLLRESFVVREKGIRHLEVDGGRVWSDLRDIKVAMEICSTETIKQAVIAGMGSVFLSAHTVGQELSAGTIARAGRAGIPADAELVRRAPAQQTLPPVAQAFKDFLVCEGAALIARLVPLEHSN